MISFTIDAGTAVSVAALLVSLISLGFSIRSSHLQNKVNLIDERLKTIELEEKEAEKASRNQSCVTIRYMKHSDKKHFIRIGNTGNVKVFNVRFEVKDNGSGAVFFHDKEPVEYLEPGDSYDEIVILTFSGTPKSTVEAVWETEGGKVHRKEYLLTF